MSDSNGPGNLEETAINKIRKGKIFAVKSHRDEKISGHFEREGGYRAEEAEKAETRRRAVKVGDRGSKWCQEGEKERKKERESKKEGAGNTSEGKLCRKDRQIEGKPRRLGQA